MKRPTVSPESSLPIPWAAAALARREGGPAALTSSASLPKAGNATIHPNYPSASVPPTCRSPSSRCQPSTAAPHGLA